MLGRFGSGEISFSPVSPEDASTVILVRESDGGLEVYMTRRQDYLSFMGGYYVFPGGKVDEADMGDEVLSLCGGFSRQEAASRLVGVEDSRRAAGIFIAAARELFEEAGVLLACRDGLGPLESPGRELSESLCRRRQDLNQDRISFSEALGGEGLTLDPGRLLWFAHWITPASSPRRFSTFFFLARKPDGQETSPCEDEVSEAGWITPRAALDKWRAGKWEMIPPTISSLDTLCRYRCWSELEADYVKPPDQTPRTVWKG